MSSFFKTKIGYFAAVVAMAIGVSGCSSPEEVAQAEEKRKNPNVYMVGTFDGCEVKFYERGYTSENFYIARCVNSKATTSVTKLESVRSGKTSHDELHLNITDEVLDINARKEQLKSEMDALETKKLELEKKNQIAEKAKQKLSAEEKSALGVK